MTKEQPKNTPPQEIKRIVKRDLAVILAITLGFDAIAIGSITIARLLGWLPQ